MKSYKYRYMKYVCIYLAIISSDKFIHFNSSVLMLWVTLNEFLIYSKICKYDSHLNYF